MSDLILAVDLGGTLTKVAWAASDGSVTKVQRLPTVRGADGSVPVDWLAAVIQQALEQRATARCRGYGLAAPGIVDAREGLVRTAPNLGWRDVPLRQQLSEQTGLNGVVGHDVRAAGLAEWRLCRPEISDLLFLSLGTGVAGAAVVDGRMLEAGGYAGEIGHWQVAAAAGRPCACGRRGCLETVASAAGITRRYLAAGGAAEGAMTVAGRARGGEPLAQALFDRAAAGLAEAIERYVTLLGPRLVLLGGGLGAASDLLLPALRDGVREGLTFEREPEIAPARLGADAGVVGAGLLGWSGVGTGAPSGRHG